MKSLIFSLSLFLTFCSSEQSKRLDNRVESDVISDIDENPESDEFTAAPENPETPENPENPETPETPEIPETPETPKTYLSLGSSHSCALLNDNSAKCWGDNYSGQLGNGSTTNSNSPVDVSYLN